MEKKSFLETIKSITNQLFKGSISSDAKRDLQTDVKNSTKENSVVTSSNAVKMNLDEPEVKSGLTVNQLLIDQLYNNPLSIRMVMNPSEEMQYAATAGDARALNFIEYPTDNVVVDTISQDPKALNYLDKIPSDELLIKILNNTPEVFQYIKKPSDKVVYEALRIDGNLIKHIEKPTLNHQIQAVKTSPSAIMHISNPSEDVQIEAVKRNRNVIEHIQNPVADILGKSGWVIYAPESNFGYADVPDQLKVRVSQQPNYNDFPTYSTLEINISSEIKANLLASGYADLGFDDSPRFDISGGFQALALNADGSMDLIQRVTAVEGGAVNYYDQTVPIHVNNCKFIELKQDLNRSPGLSR